MNDLRTLRWVSSARKDLHVMPAKVKKEFGDLLTVLQLGLSVAPPHAKKLIGFQPAVLELLEDHRRSTYRVVVTVQLEDAIYVLHCFQKKSTQGIATSKQDLELIASRLGDAVQDHEARRRPTGHGEVSP